MLAVLFENDQHSRDVLTTMLRNLGFTTVRATSRLEEFVYFLQQETVPIDLIISSQNLKNENDFSLADFAAKHPHLDRCPLVGISEYWWDKSYSPFKRRLSRVDSVLSKPLQQEVLKQGIASAFEHRASLRSTLVFYGSEASALQLEEEVLSDRDLQWKTIAHFQEPQRLTEFLAQNPLATGAILLEPDTNLPSLVKSLRQFKRTQAGASAPLGIYSQDPRSIFPFIRFLDVAFSLDYSWERVLELLSRRSRLAWRMSHRLQRIRACIKKGDLPQAKNLVKEARRWDEERWELLELWGFLTKDADAIWQALSTQPCSPYAYLTLLNLTNESDRNRIFNLSRLYCPRHPRLVELRP